MAVIKGLHVLTQSNTEQKNRITPYNEFDMFVCLACKEYIILTRLKDKSFRFILLRDCHFDCNIDLFDVFLKCQRVLSLVSAQF